MTDSVRARFKAAEAARASACDVRLAASGLEIDCGGTEELQVWPYSELRLEAKMGHQQEVVIGLRASPGAQLVLRDAAALERLFRIAPQLARPHSRRRWQAFFLTLAVMLVATVAAFWFLDVRPARAIANLIPDNARNALGRGVVEHFKQQGKVCDASAGRAALDQMLARLLARESDLGALKVTVIDLPFENAFATAGGQMVITAKLIAAAQSPDEVAGVLAHEIGHGIERHPEVALVRGVGLAILMEVITGGAGVAGRYTSGALQSGYARQDEFAADRHALRLLKSAEISYRGLENFFARLARKQTKTVFRAFDLLRTHPYPDERLAVVRRSVPYTARPALTATQWRALRAICKAN